MESQNPADAQQGEIVGRPTMLAKFTGNPTAQQVLESLGKTGYPLEDASVLFQVEGGDQVVDLATGHVAAGQSLTDEELAKKKHETGRTVVLLHPDPAQADAVRQALESIGPVEIEYSGETHAYGRPGGVERQDENVTQE